MNAAFLDEDEDSTSLYPLMHTPPSSSTTFKFTDYNQRIAVAVMLLIISIVGVIGNTLVLVAVAVSRKLHTSTNAFVVSLATTDFVTCLVMPFQVIAVLSKEGWLLPSAFCKIIGGITIASTIGSVVTLALIAVNRYVIITTERRRYQRIFSRRNITMMILFSWMFPVLTLVLPQALGYGRIGYTEKYKLCLMDGNHYYAFIYEFGAAFIQLACFIVIITCYGLIYHFLRKKMFFMRNSYLRTFAHDGNFNKVLPTVKNPSPDLSSSRATSESELNAVSQEGRKIRRKMPTKREVQITRNLFYVVCGFFVCIIPYAITISIPNSGKVLVYMGVLVTGSSVINPIIYGFNHPHFRVIFRAFLRCNLANIPEPSTLLRAVRWKN